MNRVKSNTLSCTGCCARWYSPHAAQYCMLSRPAPAPAPALALALEPLALAVAAPPEADAAAALADAAASSSPSLSSLMGSEAVPLPRRFIGTTTRG